MQNTRLLLLLFGAVVAARAAESQTNTARWIPAPSSNSMVAARWPFHWKPPFTIATSTPAFDAYGLELMLAGANEMREKWQLDIPKPLTVDDVYFAVYPTARGIVGHLMTRDRRFHWSFDRNALCAFEDRQYFAPSFRYKDDESAKLAKIQSKITKKEAETIARKSMSAMFGLSEKQLGWKRAVVVNQYKFEESDGTVYPLPLFHIEWKYQGPTQYAGEKVEAIPMEMEVSGITKRVVNYSNFDQRRPGSRLPPPVLPTNYFQMLGLPDNFLETVPARKRASWGLPPLTNSRNEHVTSASAATAPVHKEDATVHQADTSFPSVPMDKGKH